MKLNCFYFLIILCMVWKIVDVKKNVKVIKLRNMLIILFFIIVFLENIYSLFLFIWVFFNYIVFN